MVLTTTQITEQPTAADSTTISFSFQSMENQLQKWQLAIEFLKKENRFFQEMLELSNQNAKGNKRITLSNFQQKMMDFEGNDLAAFIKQLETLKAGLIFNNESRNLKDLEITQNNLRKEWEELDAVFKDLKLAAFERIEDGISISIY